MIEMHRETEQLGAYALGALDEAEAAELTAHLDGCARCRRELAELERFATCSASCRQRRCWTARRRTETCCCSGRCGRCARRKVRS